MDREGLREHLRNNITLSRQTNREKLLEGKRKALDDYINIDRVIKKDEVVLVGSKLKSKSAVQTKDLALLKLALVQNFDNTVAFLKVKGALHGLVRELSSGQPNHQLMALECCCNLALGDVKSCLQIAKAAGPYLISMLSGCNYNMLNVSVWTLGNLVGSGEKTLKVVHSQGFLPKLLMIIQDYDITEHDTQVHADILYNSYNALVQLLRTGTGLLTEEEVKSIAETVTKVKNTSVKGLKTSIFLLSCLDAAEDILIRNQTHLNSLEFMYINELNEETVASFTVSLRTVANLVAESSGSCTLQVFEVWTVLRNITEKIFAAKYSHLVKEMSWLFGNLVNHPSLQVQAVLQNETSEEFKILASSVLAR